MITPTLYVFCSENAAQRQSHVINTLAARGGEELRRVTLSYAIADTPPEDVLGHSAAVVCGAALHDITALCTNRVANIQLEGVQIDRMRVNLLFVLQAADTDLEAVIAWHNAMRLELKMRGITPRALLLWIVDDEPGYAQAQRSVLDRLGDEGLDFDMTFLFSDRDDIGNLSPESDIGRYTLCAHMGMLVQEDSFWLCLRAHGGEALATIPATGRIRRPDQEIKAILDDAMAQKVLEIAGRDRDLEPLLGALLPAWLPGGMGQSAGLQAAMESVVRDAWTALLPAPLDVLGIARNVTDGSSRAATLHKRADAFVWPEGTQARASADMDRWAEAAHSALAQWLCKQPETDAQVSFFADNGPFAQAIDRARGALLEASDAEHIHADESGRRFMERGWVYENRALYLYGIERIMRHRRWIADEILGRLAALREPLHGLAAACNAAQRDMASASLLTLTVRAAKAEGLGNAMPLISAAVTAHGEGCVRAVAQTDARDLDAALLAKGHRPRHFMAALRECMAGRTHPLDARNVFAQMSEADLVARVEECAAMPRQMLFGLMMDTAPWYKALLVDRAILERTGELTALLTEGVSVIAMDGGDATYIAMMRINGNAEIQQQMLEGVPAFTVHLQYPVHCGLPEAEGAPPEEATPAIPAIPCEEEACSATAVEDARMRIETLPGGRYVLYWRWPSGNSRDASVAFTDVSGQAIMAVCTSETYALNGSGFDVTAMLPYGRVIAQIIHGDNITYRAELQGKRRLVEARVAQTRQCRQRLGAQTESLVEYSLLLSNLQPADLEKLAYQRDGRGPARLYPMPSYVACRKTEDGVAVEGICVQEGDCLRVSVDPRYDTELYVR